MITALIANTTAPERTAIPTESEVLKLEVSYVDGLPVLHCMGEIDVYTAPWLMKLAQKKMDAGHSRFVIDLTDVQYLDASCIGTLVGILKQVRENDGNINLVISNDRIHRIFDITGLKRIFSHSPSVDQATKFLID